jgi:hypothetical protein
MSIISQLSSQIGRKDENPNKELGIKLVEEQDLLGIREIADNLSNPSRDIQIDCLGVLEMVGQLAPDLIEDYFDYFLRLALGNDNRLIWQSLINIAMIAERKADIIMDHQDKFIELIDQGTVITQDNGIKILARAGSAKKEYSQRIFPYLLDQLKICRSKSLPQYAESVLIMVNDQNKSAYLSTLRNRIDELSLPQAKRIKRILKRFD